MFEEPDRQSLHFFHKSSGISIILVLQSLLLHTMFRFVSFRAVVLLFQIWLYLMYTAALTFSFTESWEWVIVSNAPSLTRS